MDVAITEATEATGCEHVVVVCAGWNAEKNKFAAMREAFALRQLLQCTLPKDMLLWAKLNAGSPDVFRVRCLNLLLSHQLFTRLA